MIRSIPISHVIEGPQPVYKEETDWVRMWDERCAKRSALYCANGHDKPETFGPFFFCGMGEAHVSFETRCPRCQTEMQP